MGKRCKVSWLCVLCVILALVSVATIVTLWTIAIIGVKGDDVTAPWDRYDSNDTTTQQDVWMKDAEVPDIQIHITKQHESFSSFKETLPGQNMSADSYLILCRFREMHLNYNNKKENASFLHKS